MILTYLCFASGSITPHMFAQWSSLQSLGFQPSRFRCDRFARSGAAWTPAMMNKLAMLPEVAWVAVEGDAGSFRMGGISGWPGQLVVWEQEGWPDESFIDRASILPGFACALVGDGDDVFWQSTEDTDTFEVFGRSWEGLPTVWDPVFECEKVDVSDNPGRQVAVGGIWLWAASKMWFGPASFGLIDRDRLMQLPVGRVLERSDGVFVVELFSLIDAQVKIRNDQRIFWEAMDYKGVLGRSDELSGTMADPCVEFEIGKFANGGVRLITEWMDAGRPVPRSQATSRRVFELDIAGQLVAQWDDLAR
jgi:hypothetical protein